MRESTVQSMVCPKCNTKIISTTGIRPSDDVPEPGSLSICICCATILRYGDHLQLELLPKHELSKIRKAHPETYHVLMVAQRVVRKKMH